MVGFPKVFSFIFFSEFDAEQTLALHFTIHALWPDENPESELVDVY